LGLVSSAFGQQSEAGANETDRFPGTTFDFIEWQKSHEGSWILRERAETRAGRFLFGGSLAPATTPVSSDDFITLAYDGLVETSELFRIDLDTLAPEGVRELNLSGAGIRDKVAVQLRQYQDGVPVVRGFVDVLFLTDGTLTAIDSQAYPGVQDINTTPALSEARAAREAVQYFTELKDLSAELVQKAELVIYPDLSGKLAEPRLAYSIELRNNSGAQIPAGIRAYVSADEAVPTILGHDELVHECGFDHGAAACSHDHSEDETLAPVDITGSVLHYATPGTLPDTTSNPEVLMPARYMRVEASTGETDRTDLDGLFTISNTGTTPIDLTFEYRGPYIRLVNQAGATYSYTQSFTPGTFDTAFVNDERTEQTTAHANVYRSVIDMREFIVGIDPTDDTADFQMVGNVNLNDNCNAFFNGNSINFYTTGGGCVNTAFSTVVAHEEGHWLNVLYGSGNGSDGFGEGAADIWAMYLYDTPAVGEDFCGPGCDIRSGLNTRQYCGSGCYGQVHTDGEVLMGAAWKVRTNLNNSLGNAAGDLVANTIMLAWFNGFNDGQILPVIEDHWLALDDDDGNIGNGTPNYQDIDDGFRAQGFPGVDLEYIQIVHTNLADTQNEAGPYTVAANMTPQFGTAVTSATLHYTVDGGAEQTIPMSNAGAGDWLASMPGQASPSNVSYWITAEDDLANTDRYPSTGEVNFIVGLRKIAYFTDFEVPGDDGWVNEYAGGTSNDHNDWQHDTPQGNGGDPNGAFSGDLVWANDVGRSGWNGLYQANVNIRLTSPAIDCTNFSNLRLRYARWLTVESGQYDNARVRVANNLVWSNDNAVDNIDTAWSIVDYDVSAFADGNPSVELRWILQTDGGVEFGGWNIDDVMLYSLEASGTNDTIALSGDVAPTAGTTASYEFVNGPAGGTWYAVYSQGLGGTNYSGHDFDIGPGFQIAGQGTFDESGNGSIDIPVPAAATGVVRYLEIAGIDSEGFFTDSNPLTVSVQ